MPGVPREVLDQEQMNGSQADVADAGCVVIPSRSKSAAITRERALARSNSPRRNANRSRRRSTDATGEGRG